MAQLEGKVAIVTGAARGIGQAIALKMAAEGADLALCDLQQDWLAETAGKVAALGQKSLSYAVNVGSGDGFACRQRLLDSGDGLRARLLLGGLGRGCGFGGGTNSLGRITNGGLVYRRRRFDNLRFTFGGGWRTHGGCGLCGDRTDR